MSGPKSAESDDEMAIHEPVYVRPQYVSLINAADISSDDDYPVMKTPAIAPLRFDTGHSQPLRRRFFSTGGNARQRNQIGAPLKGAEQKNEALNAQVFAMRRDESAGQRSFAASSPIRQAQQKVQQLAQTQPVNSALAMEISSSNALMNQQHMAQRRLQRSRRPSAMTPGGVQAPLAASTSQLPSANQRLNQEASSTPQERSSSKAIEQAFIAQSRQIQQPSPAFKYSQQMQSQPVFSQISTVFDQTLMEQGKAEMKEQFKAAKGTAPNLSRSVAASTPQLQLQKNYADPTVIEDICKSLEPTQDWAVRDRALKDIVKAVLQNPLTIRASLETLFQFAPRLLVDLRSALVTQTLETLRTLYVELSNSAWLQAYQNFLVQLCKKAGSPSLADFMAQQTDKALMAAISQLVSSCSFQDGTPALFLQQLTLEARQTNAPGLKWRVIYLLGDLFCVAYFDLLPGASGKVMEAFGLEWSAQGVFSVQIGNLVEQQLKPIGLEATQAKLKKVLQTQIGFCADAIKKLQVDPHPEVRRAVRRLYCILKQLGLQKEKFQKIDDMLQREGVVQSWFGR